MWVIVVVVGGPGGGLDFGYMRMFGSVCSPLDSSPNTFYARRNALHQFQFWNVPVVDNFVPFAPASTMFKYGMFICVKFIEGSRDEVDVSVADMVSLDMVPEIH